jgi:hypothetical protein
MSRASIFLKSRKRLFALLGVFALIALSPAIYLFGRIGYDDLREHLRRIPFDSASWQDERQVVGHDPVRIRMVDDLINSRLLDHRSRNEVEKLLGPVPPEHYFQEYDLVYWLGPERDFMGIDSEWLVIKFDKNGIVSEYRLARD